MAKMHEVTNNQEKCTTCGSEIHRRYESEMYAGSFILNGERMEICRKPNETFRDPIKLDELTQYFNGKLYRLYAKEKYFSNGSGRLHRDVWKDAFGDIPKNCHIHHKDNNTFNNNLWNIECISSDEHLRQPRPNAKGFSEKARNAAAKWHGSPAGILWHKRNAIRTENWTKWAREPRNCLYCQQEYSCLIRKNGQEQKFCHPNCKASHYRKRKISGL